MKLSLPSQGNPFASNIDGVFSSSIAVGATPATAGAIRLPNGQYIDWRNNGDTANARVIGLSGTAIGIGDTINGTGAISLDATAINIVASGLVTLDITNQKLRINGQTSLSGAQTATFTNAPAAGNPTFYLPINIAGTVYVIPCLASA